MAAKSEILMKIESSPGKAISAECQLALDPSDTLMKDFTDGKFYQIENFSLTAGLQDESSGKSQEPAKHSADGQPALGPDGKPVAAPAADGKPAAGAKAPAAEGKDAPKKK